MCRIAGYFGPPTSIADIVTRPPRALKQQAKQPRELPPDMIGSDGYGFGWWPEHAENAAVYRQILPIWADPNLDTLAPPLRVRSLVASTRTAQPEMPVAFTNTPPFYFARTLFVHNGTAPDFHQKFAEPLRAHLPSALRAEIRGNTDSEYFAALLATKRGDTLEHRVRAFMHTVTELARAAGASAGLNIIVATEHQLVATRYAIGTAQPSLYFTTGEHGAVTIASEPLDEERAWTRFAEGTMLTANRHGDRIQLAQSQIDAT